MMDADTMVLPRLGSGEIRVEDPWGEDRAVGSRAGGHRPPADAPRWRLAAWLLPALLAGALGAVGAGTPGLRLAELATWRAATSPWPDGLPDGDVALVPYHLLMRAWAAAFGTSDLALRVPSLLAVAAAAALVGGLAARMFAPRTGLLAGVIFALLPSVTRHAQEAQPYAPALFAAVLATWFLLPALDRPSLRRLAPYAAAVALLGLCHAVALLLLVGHGWVVLAFRRGVAGRWLAAAFLGALPAAALLWSGVRAGGQVAPAARPDLAALAATPRELFGVAALGAVLLGLALFSLPLRRAAAVCTAWAVLPPLGLLALAQATPVWSPSGLLFTLPAWATLAAAALSRVRARWWVLALAALALIAAPAQAAVRAPDGHGQATREVAEIVGARRLPDDGVVYGDADARTLVARYLPADRRPTDLFAAAPPQGCAGCLWGVRRLWVIRPGERTDPVPPVGGPTERLLRSGYQVAQVWHPAGFTLALLVDDRAAR
ncbi:glycosyltransferase family 39 protein [Micromonospora chaiyaphumensis]|uniref:Mannosyltransferase n=1 Tax=Micromonospora chaiyaphumensis TaxID=307119 RepID=A0A1C4ULZ0_9ACTN|nr:glycosyltransferase family 39 protein [Micromonospora chaiyaphumensis]SCE72706.1 mannosyltransferase [Micromonospora chaiyaphumensis]